MHLDPNRFVLIVPMFLCSGFTASLQAAQFHVTVGSREAKTAGATITVPIVATAESTVGAAQLELLYDPGRLRWVGGNAGKLTANTLIDANLLDHGRVRIAFAGGEEVQGKGAIYQATFEWTDSQIASTDIGFAGVRAWDQQTGLELTTSASPGEVVPAHAAFLTPGGQEGAVPPRPVSPNSLLYVAIAVCLLTLIAAVIVVSRKKARS